jgi:hypothetical protein
MHGSVSFKDYEQALQRFRSRHDLETCLADLPAITRNVKFTIELPPDLPSELPLTMLLRFDYDLASYFRNERYHARIRGKEVQLRSLAKVYAHPVVLVPVLCYRSFASELHCIKLAGTSREYKGDSRREQTRNVLREDQQYLFLKRAIMALLPHLGSVHHALKSD